MACAGDLDREDACRGLVAATVERFGRLDILVNNSGGPPLARANNATEEQWATALQRSLLFFARMCREGLPHLKKQGGGPDHQHPGEHGVPADPEPGPVGGHAHGRGGVRQEPGRRGRARRHPRQQRVPGIDPERAHALERHGAREGARHQRGRGARAAGGRDRGGTGGRAAGVRVPRGVPRLGQVQLHHRDDDARRRRARAVDACRPPGGGPPTAGAAMPSVFTHAVAAAASAP